MSAGAGRGKPGWVDRVSVCGGWREWGGGGANGLGTNQGNTYTPVSICDRVDQKEPFPGTHVLLPHCTELLLTSCIQNWQRNQAKKNN